MEKNKGASREAIQFHYDFGNDFYAAWLDSGMTYSAALWPDEARPGIDLATAQLAKLDHHIDFVKLNAGDSLLDVGCGWGSLLNRAVSRVDLSEAVGLTLSERQYGWIKEKTADPRIECRLSAWQDFADDRRFSGIISIGALEHFARPEMSREEKLKCYEDFFRFCHEHLADKGRLSIQAITWMNMAAEDEKDNLPVDIFPESNLPQVLEIIQAAGKYFHLLQFSNRPQDYARTLHIWMKRIREHRDALAEAYGKDDVQRYFNGFANFVLGFQNGVIGLSRFGFEKRGPNWSRTRGQGASR